MNGYENLTDEELDQARRDVLTEQERRKKLHAGKQLIGQTVRDYLGAAEKPVPDLDDTVLGQAVVDLLAEYPPESAEQEAVLARRQP